mmetsp:Transcript_23679/g.42237  ORF Transcript_23679/g.42237 Transcript_23679/m.42237 type:complete len:325 (+) Transcript_23679:1558-2532(+)
MRSVVDLPQPDGPTKTQNSPSLISRSTSKMTWVAPYFLTALFSVTPVMDLPSRWKLLAWKLPIGSCLRDVAGCGLQVRRKGGQVRQRFARSRCCDAERADGPSHVGQNRNGHADDARLVLFAVIGDAVAPDVFQFGGKRFGPGMGVSGMGEIGLLGQCVDLRLLTEECHHRLAHAGAIARADLARLAEQFQRFGGVAFVHIENLTAIELRQVDRFAHRLAERIDVGARDGRKRALTPRCMGQAHKAQPRRIGLTIHVITQHAEVREGLDQPVERGLGMRRQGQQFREPHRPFQPRNEVQHIQCLADCAVPGAGRLRVHPGPPNR